MSNLDNDLMEIKLNKRGMFDNFVDILNYILIPNGGVRLRIYDEH